MSQSPISDRTNETLSDSCLSAPVSGPLTSLPPVTLTNPPSTPDKAACPRPAATRLGRYDIHSEIGRGGMGSVLRGHDPTLGRDLALKVLLETHHGATEALRRFHEEAQIGGQLQHPGLVPVYELGTDPDGRPFFAMKLVEGRTLAALLKDRKSPADDLPHFLQVFEQVCQAVGYAHARGVIHRDLKPANVMVGAFGEVQVMDWGLAKVLGRVRVPEAAGAGEAADTVRTERSESGGSESRAGSIMGTPAYMPPEQARGEIDLLDARADVFGLGAILCEVLTGKPPFVGRDVTEILSRAAQGDLAETFARLDGCGLDTELVTLARNCLAEAAQDRPADGGAVAARVAAYRAGVQERLRTAEVERAAAEARATEARARAQAERRARRLTLSLAASVLLMLLLGGGGLAWLRQQRLERAAEQARQEADLVRLTENDLGRAALAKQAKKWEDAWKAIERAEERLGTAGPEELRNRVQRVRQELERVRKDQQMIARLDEARLQVAAPSSDGAEPFDRAGADRLYRAAFRDYGIDLWAGSAKSASDRIAASAIRERLIVGLDDWSFVLRNTEAAVSRRLREIASEVDGNRWRRSLRTAFGRRDWLEVGRLADKVALSELAPEGLEFLSDILRDAGSRRRSLAILQQGQRRYPGDFWLTFELAHGWASVEPPQFGEAVRYYTAALALRPDSTIARANLLGALAEDGKLPEAEAIYREGVRLQPVSATTLLNGLIPVLRKQKKLSQAETACREAIRHKSDDSGAHTYLGLVLADRGQLPAAVASLREAIRLKPDHAWAHNCIGVVFKEQKKLPEAESALREAIRHRPAYADAYGNLGNVLWLQKKYREAEMAYREVLRVAPRSVAAALAHNGLGWVFQSQRKLPESEAAFREAIRLKPDLVDAHNSLGNLLWNLRKLPEAEAVYREAIRIKPDYDWGHINLGGVLRLQKKYAEAEAELRKGIQLNPTIGHAYNNLANVLKDQGKLAEAEAAYREGIRVNPDYEWPHCNLGFVYRIQGKFAESLAAFRRGHELGSRSPGWREPSERWVREAERLVELDRRLPDILSGKGKVTEPSELLLLARACRYKRWHVAAVRFQEEAFAGKPELASSVSPHARLDAYRGGGRHSARYDAACSAVLAGCGQGEGPQRPDERERDRLRAKARSWLHDDLAAWSKRLEDKPKERERIQRVLRHWKNDAALAGVRGDSDLVKLPEAERAEWRKLWQEVDALLKKTSPNN